MTMKSMASLKQIADLKRQASSALEGDDESVSTVESDEGPAARAPGGGKSGSGLRPSELSDVPKQTLDLFHKYNYLADEVNSTLWSMRATQKGAKTAAQISQLVSKGTVSSDKRWVTLEEVDTLEVKYSKHMADLLERNQKLFGLVEDMRKVRGSRDRGRHLQPPESRQRSEPTTSTTTPPSYPTLT